MTVALISRNPERSGRLKLGFLDKDNVKGMKRQKVSEFKGTGPHSVCVPLKNPELIKRRWRAKIRGAKRWGRRGNRRERRSEEAEEG